MTSPLDVISGTACQLGIPGVQPWGPGWFLLAAGGRVEQGPFLTAEAAQEAAEWMDANSYGVFPMPWVPIYSSQGLTIGSRRRTVTRK